MPRWRRRCSRSAEPGGRLVRLSTSRVAQHTEYGALSDGRCAEPGGWLAEVKVEYWPHPAVVNSPLRGLGPASFGDRGDPLGSAIRPDPVLDGAKVLLPHGFCSTGSSQGGRLVRLSTSRVAQHTEYGALSDGRCAEPGGWLAEVKVEYWPHPAVVNSH